MCSDIDIDAIDNEDEINNMFAAHKSMEITDKDIERARVMKTHPKEQLYRESAIALYIGFFEETVTSTISSISARKMQHEKEGQI
jgi:hypothetical protein